ncbi:MAG: translation elongation factor [bacterium]
MNKIESAWQSLFKKFNILEEIKKHGPFLITSKQINEFKESRVMTKFDHSSNLPKLFFENDLSVLPITHGSYLIGNFDSYFSVKGIPHKKPAIINFPNNLESININNIYSEAAALNCAYVSEMLNDVIGDICFPTISGRMSTSKFDFIIKNKLNSEFYNVNVANSQCEIDGGYESDNALMIIEAKNYSINDFLIRQLYYPYRLWISKVKKPVIPVFLTYSNNIFSFSIYGFEKPDEYNSLVLKEQKNFMFAPEEITIDEIKNISDGTKIIPELNIPFPQADSFERVVDLFSLLLESDLTLDEIKSNYAFDVRQAAYYISALQYLGLVEKINRDGEVYCHLNNTGKRIVSMPFKQKYLEIAKCILQHEVFNKVLQAYFSKAAPVTKEEAITIMKSCNIYNVDKESSTVGRRAQTVIRWIEWILELVNG